MKKNVLILSISILLWSCNSKSSKNETSETSKEETTTETPTINSVKLFNDYFHNKSISKLDYDNKEFIITDLIVTLVHEKDMKREVEFTTYRTDDVFDGKTIPKPDGWGYKYVKINNTMYRFFDGGKNNIYMTLKDPHQLDIFYPDFKPQIINLTDSSDVNYPTYTDVSVFENMKIVKVKGKIKIQEDRCVIEDGEIIN